MSKPVLRLVPTVARPLANLSRAEKLARAKAYVQRTGEFAHMGRSLYVLDRGTPKPSWGTPNELPQEDTRLLTAVMDADRRRK